MKFIKEQNTLSEKSDTSSTLGGDLTLQTIESRLRSAIFTPIQTEKGPMRIGDLGITYQREGHLKFDSAKFESALAADYKRVAQVLTGIYSPTGKTDGFIDNLEKTTMQLLANPNGALVTRSRGLKSNISQIDRQIGKPENEDLVQTDINTMFDVPAAHPVLGTETFKMRAGVNFDGFKLLYETYRGIQTGALPDKLQWMYPAEGI